MGSATRAALTLARNELASTSAKDGLIVGGQLFDAGRTIGDSAALRSALADPAAAANAKTALVGTLFKSLGAPARSILSTVVAARWSSQDDLLAGIEELGIRGRESFEEAGGTHFARLDCLNASDEGMTMLCRILSRELAGWVEPA